MTALFQLHNIMLSSGSLILLILMVEEIVPIVFRCDLFYGICRKGTWTPVHTVYLSVACAYTHIQKLKFYYMINYYVKFLELLNTIFLALKKKPLGMTIGAFPCVLV